MNRDHCWRYKHDRRSQVNISSLFIGLIWNLLVVSEQNSTVGPAYCTLSGEACLNLPVGSVEAHLHTIMALLTLRRIPSISTPPVSSLNPMMLLLGTHKWVCRAWAQHTVSSLLSCAYRRITLNGPVSTLHVPVVPDWEYFRAWLNYNKLLNLLSVSAPGAALFDHNMRCDWISCWLWKWLLHLCLIVLIER